MLTLTLSTKFAYDSSKEGVSVLTYTEERLSQWVGLPWIAASQPASTHTEVTSKASVCCGKDWFKESKPTSRARCDSTRPS